MNLVHRLVCHECLVTQWLKHPTGLCEVIGSNPVGDSDFVFVPCSCHFISSPSLTFTMIILNLSPHMMLLTLLILAVCRTHVIREPSIWPGSPQVSHSI